MLLLAAIMVRLSGPGPVLLRQVRIGRHEKPFVMLKFRTMHAGVSDRSLREMNMRELRGEEPPGSSDGVFKLQDDDRITPAGRWLRRFSIDRHECVPGMTGLWQVSGRNRLSMPEMLALDLEYICSRSIALDLRILASTPAAVLFDRSVR
jgi:lipopolysaccharide/colanic/teichoic acid biosynthesis glycosyltransferase